MRVKKIFFREPCVTGRQVQVLHPTRKKNREYKPDEIVHSDVCGPFDIESPGESKYFVLFKDDFSDYRTVYFMHHKSEVFEKFKQYEALVSNQTGNKMKVLRSDKCLEYLSNEFKVFLENKGIVYELSTPYVHEQNDSAEREIRKLVGCARIMLLAINVPRDVGRRSQCSCLRVK